MNRSKAKNLLGQFSDTVSDSIGIRSDESTRPRLVDETTGGPSVRDYKLNRSMGSIEVERIAPDPNQPRKDFNEEQLQQLADSLKTDGQLQPIRVRWDEESSMWLIIVGERRWRAAKLAGLERLMCVFVKNGMSEEQIRSQQVIENLQRSDLKPIEEAQAFRDLMKLNSWNTTELAATLHISRPRVSRSLSLLKLPEDIRAKVNDGTIKATAGYELSKVKDEDELRELAEKAANGEAKYEETSKAAKQTRKDGKKKRRSTNETFRTSVGLKVVASSRKNLDDSQLLEGLLEVVEQWRKRTGKVERKKAA